MFKLLTLMTILIFSIGSTWAKKERKIKPLQCPKEGEKVVVCHMPPGNPNNSKTLAIDEQDAQDHLDHGDLAGFCPEVTYEQMKAMCGICDADIDSDC